MNAESKFNDLKQMRDLFEQLKAINDFKFSIIHQNLELCFHQYIKDNKNPAEFFITYNDILRLLFEIKTNRDMIAKEYEILDILVKNWNLKSATLGIFGILIYSS